MNDYRKSLCVNACEGIPTTTLESIVSAGVTLSDEIERLVATIKSIHDHPNCRYEVEAQLGDETWDVIAKYDQQGKPK